MNPGELAPGKDCRIPWDQVRAALDRLNGVQR